MEQKDTLTDSIFKRAKDHPIIAAFIVIGACIVGIATVTNAVESIARSIQKYVELSVGTTAPVETTEKSESTTRIDTDPEPESNTEKTSSENIDSLLNRAERLVSELKLTTPSHNNAFDVYRQVLSIDPNNTNAKEGLKRIATKYVVLASNQVRKGKLELAEKYLQKAFAIDSDAPEYQETKESWIVARQRQSKSEVRTETTKHSNPECAEIEKLRAAAMAASGTSYYGQRDEQYSKIVKAALCAPYLDLAVEAASDISYYSSRDDALLLVVDAAIKAEDYDAANKAANLISYYNTKGIAKQRIVDALVTEEN